LKNKKPLTRALLFLCYGFFLFGITEAALRLQQKWGPLYDLDFKAYSPDLLSDTLNHKPHPLQGFTDDGIQLNPNRPLHLEETFKGTTFLFMGDSFMQGLSGRDTIPQILWEKLRSRGMDTARVRFLNAGYSSYSPSIYIPQARMLVPRYKPDFLVLSLDESDMVDDYANYRPRLVRDKSGRITAVRRSPVYHTKVMGLVRLQKEPIYTLRLFRMFFHKWVRMNIIGKRYRHQYKAKYYRHPYADRNVRYSYNLVPAFDETADAKHYEPEAIYYRHMLEELMQTLIELMGSADKILIVTHPHLHHLVPDERGILWQSPASDLAAQTAMDFGIPFYHAAEDMRQAFGDNPETYYVQTDMHLNPAGLKIYADLITAKIPFPKAAGPNPGPSSIPAPHAPDH